MNAAFIHKLFSSINMKALYKKGESKKEGF